MATDQGKLRMKCYWDIVRSPLKNIEEIGTTTFRMPYNPTSLGMIAGRNK